MHPRNRSMILILISAALVLGNWQYVGAQTTISFKQSVTLRTGTRDVRIQASSQHGVVTLTKFRDSAPLSEDSLVFEERSADLFAADLNNDGIDELVVVVADESFFLVMLYSPCIRSSCYHLLEKLLESGDYQIPDELAEEFSIATKTQDDHGYDRIVFHYVKGLQKRSFEIGYDANSKHFIAWFQ